MPPFALYARERLPIAFEYPAQFAAMATSGEQPAIGKWWFIDASSEAGELFYSVRNHDGRNLIPFAKGDDDLACFDGDDASGDPTVLMLVLDGSGRHYSFKSFADWLCAARTSEGP